MNDQQHRTTEAESDILVPVRLRTNRQQESKPLKLVVVGSHSIGKTCLLTVFVGNKFPRSNEYVPVVFESWADHYEVDDGRICLLQPWELPSSCNQDRLRPLAYPMTDVILLCFSLVNPDSFEAITTKWYPEVAQYCPDIPKILVGTKLDLREDPEYSEKYLEYAGRAISMEEGLRMQSKHVNIVKYMECSSLTQYGVKEVFDEAIKAGLDYQKKTELELVNRQTKTCTIT